MFEYEFEQITVRGTPRAGHRPPSRRQVPPRNQADAANEAQREAIRASAAADIGGLNGRELLIAGAIAYWCEGAKNKPHNRHYRIAFINSDPDLVRLFLRFLCAAGVASEDLIFVVHIHERADVEAASRFWLDVTGAPASQFRRPALKRHNPATIRKNTGESYHGCLRVEVRRSSSLYLRIEGWVRAAMTPGTLETGKRDMVPNQ